MAQKIINIGIQGNDGTGDSIRTSFQKVNDNFSEIYAFFGQGGTIKFSNLSDAPNSYGPNTLIAATGTGNSLSAKTLIGEGVVITQTDNSITLSTSNAGLVSDQTPTLIASINANNLYTIGNLPEPSNALVEQFNILYPNTPTTIDRMPITVGYANSRFVTQTDGRIVNALRVRNQPLEPETTDPDYDETLSSNYLSSEAIQRKDAVYRGGDTMTGKLTLSDHPAPLEGAAIVNGADDLQAATKYYVDNQTYYSGVNLYVSTTKGDDLQGKTPVGREGSAWQYAFKTVGAAMLHAENLISLSTTEPGPYRQTISYTISPNQYKSTVQSFGLSGGNSNDPGYTSAASLLNANKEFIQAETIAYINKKYVNSFSFDPVIYKQIMTDILRGVGYDLVLGTNYNSVTQASKLFNSYNSDIINNQLAQIISGIDFARAEILSYSYNTESVRDYVGQIIDALMFDMLTGSNFQSIQVARGFQYAGTDLSNTQMSAALTDLGQRLIVIPEVASSPDTAVVSIESNIDVIKSVILTGEIPKLKMPPLQATATGQNSARDLLLANVPFIQSEIIAFLLANYPKVTYNQATCRRDVQFIVWALAYDQLYGGNTESVLAGMRYWFNYSRQINISELQATLASIDYINTLAQAVITNTPPAILYQQSVTQYTNATYSNGSVASASISANVATIRGIVGSQTQPTPVVTPITVANTPGDLRAIKSAVELKTGLLKTDTVNYINDTFPVINDLQTINTINTLFNTITDMLRYGVETRPAITFETPTDLDTGYLFAQQALSANIDFITAEANAYIDVNYPADGYSKDASKRDVTYLLNAIAYDLTYGGTAATAEAANQFIARGNRQLTTAHIAVCSNALLYAESVATQVAVNDTVTGVKQTLVTQVKNSGWANGVNNVAAANKVASSFLIARNVINTQLEASPTYPSAASYINNAQFVSAKTIIDDNTQSVAQAVVEYLTTTFVGGFSYNEEICKRDVGLIISGLAIDLLTGGTYQSIYAGKSYYRNASSKAIAIGTQYTETLDALEFTKSLALEVLNQVTASRYQTLVEQVLDGGLEASVDAINTFSANYEIMLTIVRNGVGAAPQVSFGSGIYTITFSNGGNYSVDQGLPRIAHIIPGKILLGNSSGAYGQIVSYTPGSSTGYDTITMRLTRPGAFLVGETLDYGETVSNQNITVNVESGIYYEDYPIKLPENVTIKGDDFRRTIIRPLDRISQSPWRTTFFYRDAIIDGMQLGAIDYAGTDYAATLGTDITLTGTTGNIAITLGDGQAPREWVGLVITDDTGQLPQIQSVKDNVSVMVGILTSGLSAVPSTVITDPTNYDTGFFNARRLLLANRQFIIDEIASFMNANYPSIWSGLGTSGQATCTRDIGYIIDALEYDLTYQGNLATVIAARSYYSNGVFVEPANQKTAALAVQDRLQTILPSIVQGIAVNPSLGNSTLQYTAGVAGSITSGSFVGSRIGEIKNAINTGLEPTTVNPDTTWLGTKINNIFSQINIQKSALQSSSVNFVISNFPSVTFNHETCSRDIGYITDALAYDMMFGSNFLSILAARAYYRGLTSTQVVLATQLSATISVIRNLSSLITTIISGTPGKAVINTVSGNILNCTVIYPFTSDQVTNGIPAGSWHMYGTLKYGRHYLSDPLDINSTPKNNKEVDVFLTNDANRIKLITCQGHGGFMMVLDPSGQIKTKSPYAQESASFAGSINAKRFAGGQFIDGFAGRLNGTIVNVEDAGVTLTVQGFPNSGLDVRAPQVPCAFYVEGERYQVNDVVSYDSTTATVVITLDTATPFFPQTAYSSTAFSTNLGSIIDAVRYDMVLGSNVQTVKAGLNYLLPQNKVNGLGQALVTQGLYKTGDLIGELSIDSGNAQTVKNNLRVVANILNSGSLASPTLTYPLPNGVTESDNVAKAKTILIANKGFIQQEITAWIAANYTVSTIPGYDAVKSQRDIGYIIDSIVYDVLYGGNSMTYDTALAFWNNGESNTAGSLSVCIASFGRLSTILQQIVQGTPITKSAGNPLAQDTSNPASGTEATLVGTLVSQIIDYVGDGDWDTPTSRTNPTITGQPSQAQTDFSTINSNKSSIQSSAVTYLNSGGGININIEMAGNRSMLANDFTQVNDLGYGILATNGGLTEQVSTFTYYCHTGYWALNGGQIRSVAGSNSNGTYGIRATGYDLTELPDLVTLTDDMVQTAYVYKQGTAAGYMTPTANQQALSVWIVGYEYTPLNNSELEIDHHLSGGTVTRYFITSVQHTNIVVNGQNVLQLGLSTAGANGTNTTGLLYALYDGQPVTIRMLNNVKLIGVSQVRPVRPSTALQYTTNLADIYRIISYGLTESTGELLPTATAIVQSDTSYAFFSLVTDVSKITQPDPTDPSKTQGSKVGDNRIAVQPVSSPSIISQINTGSYIFGYAGRVHRAISYTPPTSIAQGLVLTASSTLQGTSSTGNYLTLQNTSTLLVNQSIVFTAVTQTPTLQATSATGNYLTLSTVSGLVVGETIVFSAVAHVGSATATQAGTNYITLSNGTSGMAVGEQILFTGLAFGGLAAGTYYVTYIANSTQIRVSTTFGGTSPTLSDATSSQMSYTAGTYFGGVTAGTTYYIKTINTNTQQITISTSFNGTTVPVTNGGGNWTSVAGGTLGGITSNTNYYILSNDVANRRITVSTTVGGPAVSVTAGAGSWLAAAGPNTSSVTLSVSNVTGTISAGQVITGNGFTGGQTVVSYTVQDAYTVIILSGIPNSTPSGTITFGATVNGYLTIDPNPVYNVTADGNSLYALTYNSKTAGPENTTYQFVTFDIPFESKMPRVGGSISVANNGTAAYNDTVEVYSVANYTTITVPTTTGLVVGMVLTSTSPSAYIPVNCIVQSIDDSTHFTVSPSCWIPPGTAISALIPTSVQSVTIINGGSGYDPLNPPTLTFTGGGAITQAIATCTVNNAGVIDNVIIVSAGYAYTYLPQIEVSSGFAQLQAVLTTSSTYSSASASGVNTNQVTLAYTSDPGSFTNGTPVTITGQTSKIGPAAFTATINASSTTMTIGTVTSGTIAIGQIVTDDLGYLPSGTYIVSGSGSSWTLSAGPIQNITTSNATVKSSYAVKLSFSTTTAPTVGAYFKVAGNGTSLYNGTWKCTNSTTTSITLSYPYDPGTWGAGTTTVTKEITTSSSTQLGISKAFSQLESSGLRLGHAAGTTGQITVSISTCRATGHDFLDIGTGGYNTSNYPNVIYGSPAFPVNASYQVLEETVGRVFYVSTDQNGIFRVGRFFTVDQGTGTVTFSASIALSNLDGLGFKRGVVVSEFSTDSSLSNNATDTVPVESAVRGFVDYRLGLTYGGAPVASNDLIGPGYLALNGALAMKGNINMANYGISNLVNPSYNQDAATKVYVDTGVASVNSLYKLQDVNITTVSNPSATYNGNALTYDYPSGKWKNITIPNSTTSANVTAASGDGNNAVLTFANQTPTPFVSGQTVTVVGMTPAGYNGTWVLGQVTVGASTTTVQLTGCTATGSMTVAGLIIGNDIVNTYNSASGTITSKIANNTIVNSMINTNAAIAQSKLAMRVADTSSTAPGSTDQSVLGLARFNSNVFTATNGWIDVISSTSTTTGITYGRMQYMSAGSILGNRTGSPTTPSEMTPAQVVTDGNGLKNAPFANSLGVMVVTGNANTTFNTVTNVGGGNTYGVIAISNPTSNAHGANSFIQSGSDASVDVGSLKVQGYNTISISGTTVQFTTPGGYTFQTSVGTTGSNNVTTMYGTTDFTNGTLKATTITTGAAATTASVTGKYLFTTGSEIDLYANSATLTVGKITTGGAANGGQITGTWTVAAGSTFTATGIQNQANSATTTATSSNTANQIVLRDAGGNFSAGTITAALTGNATSASKWATARTVTFTGDVTGSFTIDGSADVTAVALTVGADKVALGTDTTGNYAASVAVSGNGLSITGTAGEGTAFTVNSNATNANTASTLVFRDASGNFSAGTITAALSGNASTATKLSTTRDNWSTNAVIDSVVGQLSWKNYGNGHTIFDASAGTSPSGSVVGNTDASIAWSATYPTLMGWNGSSTYGVRVDSARLADSIKNQANSATITATNANTGSTIVYRDGSGNFSAGTITATLAGNASTASEAAANYFYVRGTSPSVLLVDTDSGGAGVSYTRYLHHNGGLIGFLNKDGNWIMNVDDNSTVTATLFSGTATAARYADLAERYEADATYEPGTVVIFGGDKEITTTNLMADTRVAGVISTKPALMMNSDAGNDETHPYVAIAGRVPCKVVGRVKKGDMLTTSATPGYACKAIDPKLGSIIGKALENKDYGEAGVIEVAVGRT